MATMEERRSGVFVERDHSTECVASRERAGYADEDMAYIPVRQFRAPSKDSWRGAVVLRRDSLGRSGGNEAWLEGRCVWSMTCPYRALIRLRKIEEMIP